MDTLSYIALPSLISTIWPLPTTISSNSSGLANTLPPETLVYLDSQPIIQSIFQGIPISSCSTVRKIQTVPCYDVFTFTTSRCTTIESTVAASANNLTRCVTTTDIVTRPRFWNSEQSRGGLGGVGRISAQLLTYITGEPVYGPTPDAQATVAPTDLPLSEARIAAIPASTWDAINRSPVETQGASVFYTGTPAAATSEDPDTGAQLNVPGHVLLNSGLQALPDGSRASTTEHHVGGLTLPTTSPRLEHADVPRIVSAVQEVASGLQASRQKPQELDSWPPGTASSNFELPSAEHSREDDGKDDRPPTATQVVEDVKNGILLSGGFASTTFRLSQEHDHDTLMGSKTAVAADRAPKSPGVQRPLPTTPVPMSTTMQPQTLAPGGVLDFGNAHLSVLPDASGLTLSNGSTFRLKDGRTAEINVPDGLALRLSQSGTVYLANTRTEEMASQLTGTGSNGPSGPARTTGQITGEDVSSTRSIAGAPISVATEGHAKGTAAEDASLSRSISEAATGVATDGSAKGTASEVSTGGAPVCVSDVWGFVVGLLVALVWVFEMGD